MAKWAVTGADPATGREQTIELEAVDESEASAKATYAGLLISSVRLATPPAPKSTPDGSVLEYRNPTTTNRPTPPPPPVPDISRAVLLNSAERRAVMTLRVLAAFFYLGGFAGAIGAWAAHAYKPVPFQDDHAVGAMSNTLARFGSSGTVELNLLLAVMCFVAAAAFQIGYNTIINRGTIRAMGVMLASKQ